MEDIGFWKTLRVWELLQDISRWEKLENNLYGRLDYKALNERLLKDHILYENCGKFLKKVQVEKEKKQRKNWKMKRELPNETEMISTNSEMK